MFFKPIVRKYGQWILGKRIKRLQRQGRFHGYGTAKSIGIIFDASKTDNFTPLKSFVKELKHKGLSVDVLGLFEGKELPKIYQKEEQTFVFLSKDDYNWYKAPLKNEAVLKFIEQPFSILMDLTMKEAYANQYVIALSKAEFKVGSAHENRNYCDFFIQLKETSSIKELITQIDYYLLKFKTE